jgi:hypothetical protein
MSIFDALRPKKILGLNTQPGALVRLDQDASNLYELTGDYTPVEDIQVLDIIDGEGQSMEGWAYNCVPTCSGEHLNVNIFRAEELEKAFTAAAIQTEAALPTHLAHANFYINVKTGAVQGGSREALDHTALLVTIRRRQGETHVEVAPQS